MNLPGGLREIAEAFPYPLVFATVSGAHLYGFPSADSDYDLRACHVLPTHKLVGLADPKETEERMSLESGLELDLVSHDLRKFCRLLMKPNGYVLEQVLSPLVVMTSPEHGELKAMVPRLVTRHHSHHYLGFARGQWDLFEKEPRVKTLLYVYRVLLTGIHLMRSGQVQASLPDLLVEYPQAGVQDLIDAKMGGEEKQGLEGGRVEGYRQDYDRLVEQLQVERDRSGLPEHTSCYEELDRLVVGLRLGEAGS